MSRLEELLVAEDESGFGGGHVGGGVKYVGILPGFEGVAPGGAGGVGADPVDAVLLKRRKKIRIWGYEGDEGEEDVRDSSWR